MENQVSINDCRWHVLPLMQALNSAADEWNNAPIEVLRQMSCLQDMLTEIVSQAMQAENDHAWRRNSNPKD